IQRCYPI
ncbi:Bcl-2-like protein, partial [Monkeypox virus]